MSARQSQSACHQGPRTRGVLESRGLMRARGQDSWCVSCRDGWRASTPQLPGTQHQTAEPLLQLLLAVLWWKLLGRRSAPQPQLSTVGPQGLCPNQSTLCFFPPHVF